MDCKLIGGALDGKQFFVDNPNDVKEKLTFRNPCTVKFESKLCEPLILSRVIYKRDYVLDGIVYYKFHGYIE